MESTWENTRVLKSSLAVQTADILRKKIISGELALGERLVDANLAEAFGISKVSIREAVLILMKEQLLEKEKNKFTRVVVLSRNDVRELFEMRSAMEQIGVERCIKDGTVPYEKLINQANKIKSLIGNNQQAINGETFIDEDMRFHQIIMEACGNKRALNTWKQIEAQTKILFYSQIKRNPFSVSNEPEQSHENIAFVMKQGKVEEAKALIRWHLYGAYEARISDPSLTD